MSNIFIPGQDSTISALFVATFGVAPGSTYLTEAKLMTTTQVAQILINASGASTPAALTTLVMSHFGVTAAMDTGSLLSNYITAQFTTAGVANSGATLVALVNAFPTLSNATIFGASIASTYGAAADAFAGQANIATAYSLVAANNSTDLSVLAAVVGTAGVAPGTTFTLTTGIDTGAAFIGGAGNDTFNAIGTAAANAFNALDSINGGGGNDVLNVVSSLITSLAAGQVTVTNIETANITDAATVVLDTTGWTGLTSLNILGSVGSAALADAITASATTAVALTETKANSTGTTTVDGGAAVTLTETANDSAVVTTLGAIRVGSASTAPTGAVSLTSTTTLGAASSEGYITVTGAGPVTINDTVNDGVALLVNGGGAQTNGNAGLITVAAAVGAVNVTSTVNSTVVGGITTFGDAIVVTGGAAAGATTINVTEAATQTIGATTVSSFTEGSVTITGDGTTTAVTVTQAAVASGTKVTAASPAVVGLNGVAAATAAPGINARAVVTQTTTASSSAAVTTSTPTVTADGVVAIQDKSYNTTTANTITTVSLTDYGNSTIKDNALSTLSLSGTGGTLTITNATAGNATPTTNNTTLTLNVNNLSNTGAAGTNNTISDANGEYTVVNIVTGATASSILGAATYATTAFSDAGLVTVNVSGSSVLTMGAWGTAPATLNVTGAAGYTGYITDTTTTFNASGATGRDIITIGAVPTKAITGSSATNNEIVINASAIADTTATAANLAAFNSKVTGFKVLGVDVNTTGTTFDMSTLTAGFNAIDVTNTAAYGGSNTTVSFINVVAGTTLSLDANNTGTIVYQTSDTTASADTVQVTLKGAVSALTLEDSTAINGIGTVNFNVSSTGSIVGAGLVDTGITNLGISGSKAFSIITSAYADSATTLTINNTDTFVPTSVAAGNFPNAAATFFGITDNNLANLAFAGSNSTLITTLTDSSAAMTINSTSTGFSQIATYAASAGGGHVTFTGTGNVDVGVMTSTAATIVLANSGTGTVSVADAATYGGSSAGLVDANITSLTLTGQIAFGADTSTLTTAIGGTNLATIAAGTDNAHINITVGAVANGTVTSYVLGNGNDYFTSGSTAGQITLTVGTGSNLIDVSSSAAGNNTFLATITEGAHTSAGPDKVLVGAIGTNTGANTVITGAVAGDQFFFKEGAGATTVQTFTAGQLATLAGYGTAALAVAAADALMVTAHNAAAFVWGGNTYIIDTAAGTGSIVAANDSVIELIGTHTLSSTVTGGVFTLAS